MADNFNEFLNLFLDEAQDALNVWEKSCLDLERDDSMEAREDLYRSAHNLKSGSGAVGLSEFNGLVHKVEDLIAKLLAGQVNPDPAILKVLLSTHSVLATWLNHIRAGQSISDHEDLPAIVSELQSILGRIGLQNHQSSPINSNLTSEPLPPVESNNTSDPIRDPSPVEMLLQSLKPNPAAPGTASSVDSLNTQTPSETSLTSTADSKGVGPSLKNQESIRVAATKLDQLIQLVGELSTQQAIVWHARQNSQLQSKSSDNAIQLIQKIAKDLQGLALSLRLQPLQSLFQRLERTARDLARQQGKKIEVLLQGDYVEVDRSVIERIADAMNHVIRNAVDHGIETPLDRQAAGKNEAATLRIEAVQETGGVMIRVSDDGRGLNTEKILLKAIERGIVKAGADLAPQDIHRLIFHAGLSTADKITDISGRGVGMDVVKNSVETIGGSIHVSSQAKMGTTFAISLPATLSIIDALIVTVEGIRYAIPVQDVAEIINARQSKIKSVAGFGRLLSLRDTLIPVEILREHMPAGKSPQSGPSSLSLPEYDSVQTDFAGTIRPALIIRGGMESLAFEVDSILGQQPVTVRRLPHMIASIPGYTGGTILGDGDPCVILNLPALMSRHFDRVNRSKHRMGEDHLNQLDENQEDRFNSIENRFLIFESHGREFGVPLLTIREILRGLRCEPMVGAAPHLLGCINIRGLLLAVYDLGVILGLPASTSESSTDIVLEDGKSGFAVRVQRVASVANIRLLESPIKDKHQDIIPGFFGYLGTGMYQGKPIPLLDLSSTVRLWEEQTKTPSPLTQFAENTLEAS